MVSAWWWFLFLALNAIVAAVAVLSSRARPPLPPPRDAAAITRRASSAVLQRLRSFSIFSFPSACFPNTGPLLQPDAEQTEEEPAAPTSSPIRNSPTRALVLAPHAPVQAVEEEEDPNEMSMDEAYALVALVVAGRSEVDAKADEFIQEFKESLREQRLNSIFNYTQRAFGRGRR